MPHRSSQLAALAILALALAGCRGGAEPAGEPTTGTPTTDAPSSCNHAPDTGGGDGGLGAGWDYAETEHEFGTSAPITLCMTVPHGTVIITGDAPEVTVAPETRPGPGTRFTFTVTVAEGATGDLDVELVDDDGDAGMTFHGPAIETNEAGWSFGPWG